MTKKKVEKSIAIEMFKKGETIYNIAKYFNVTYGRIYQIVHKLEINQPVGSVARSINKSRVYAINILGGKCKRCGFDDIRALQIDHVNGGGNKEHKEGGSYKIYLKIISNKNAEGEYQLLCANCNWIKRYENKEVRNGISHIKYERIENE